MLTWISAACSKTVALLFLLHCLLLLPFFVGVLCLVLVLLFITLCPSSFFNHLDREETAGCFNLVAFLVTVNVLCLFLTVSLVYLQCVIVVFPDHTHLLFSY